MTSPANLIPHRKAVMALLARATLEELEEALERFAPLPPMQEPRPAEVGLAMLRGRIGGDGGAFNLGEATVTRAAVHVNDSTGVSYILGRAPERARAAAVLDALWQDNAARLAVEEALGPVRKRLAKEEKASVEKTAATRVNFFTLARGED